MPAPSPAGGPDGALVAPLLPVPHARGRVVAIPHAGAGPHALLPVLRMLPASIEAVGVTLPGRERRFAESPTRTASDPGAVVAAVHAELAALPPLPTVLFGHSMGAALGAAVAAHAPRHYAGAVLSALPGMGSAAQRAGRWSESELVAILRCGGGTPDDVIANPAWREHLLALLRSDLTLGVRLVALLDAEAALAPPVSRVPTTVLAGAADDIARRPADVLIAGHRALRMLPGGHFYLLDEPNVATVARVLGAAFDDPDVAAAA